MDNWFQSKWFVRIISLAFAILLYVFVTIEVEVEPSEDVDAPGFTDSKKEVEVLEDIPVDVKIDSDKYVVSGVPEEVEVSLEGPVSVLTPVVRQKNFTTYVDLTELSEGPHTVEIQHENIPKELSAYIDPKEIDIKIEERATETFDIQAELINEDLVPVGYEVGTPELNVEEVLVVGSKSTIEEISLVKAYLDVANEKESIKNRELPVNVYDSDGNKLQVNVKPESVIASVKVDKPSKEVNLKISTKGNVSNGSTLKSLTPEIENIMIYGKKADLDEIDEISSDPIDLSEINESTEMNVKLDVPDNVSISQKKVKVDIELKKTS